MPEEEYSREEMQWFVDFAEQFGLEVAPKPWLRAPSFENLTYGLSDAETKETERILKRFTEDGLLGAAPIPKGDTWDEPEFEVRFWTTYQGKKEFSSFRRKLDALDAPVNTDDHIDKLPASAKQFLIDLGGDSFYLEDVLRGKLHREQKNIRRDIDQLRWAGLIKQRAYPRFYRGARPVHYRVTALGISQSERFPAELNAEKKRLREEKKQEFEEEERRKKEEIEAEERRKALSKDDLRVLEVLVVIHAEGKEMTPPEVMDELEEYGVSRAATVLGIDTLAEKGYCDNSSPPAVTEEGKKRLKEALDTGEFDPHVGKK